jgi:flagellar biosynthesis anti-sigma factor FlgM
MSIDRLSAQSAARTYVQNAEVSSANSAAKTKSAEKAAGQSRADSVVLSADARSLAAARDAVQHAPDVRAEKVDAIKQRITDGTYHVPANVLARKLLDGANQD